MAESRALAGKAGGTPRCPVIGAPRLQCLSAEQCIQSGRPCVLPEGDIGAETEECQQKEAEAGHEPPPGAVPSRSGPVQSRRTVRRPASTASVAAFPGLQAGVPQNLDQGHVPGADGDHDRPRRRGTTHEETVARLSREGLGQGLDGTDPVHRHPALQRRGHLRRHVRNKRRGGRRAHHGERGQRRFGALRRLREPHPGRVRLPLDTLQGRRLGAAGFDAQSGAAPGEHSHEAGREQESDAGERPGPPAVHRSAPAGSITK